MAVRIVLLRLPRFAPVTKILCWCDNSAVTFIVRAMVTASKEMMQELRLLKRVMDQKNVII